MTVRIALAAALAVGLSAPVAMAQTPAPRPEAQQQRAGSGGRLQARYASLAKRIRAGHEAGRISAAEGRRLAAAHRALRAQAQRFRASDGRIDLREARQLHRGLNRLSLAIARAARGGGGR